MGALEIIICMGAVGWQHPSGAITDTTLAEVHEKVGRYPWARDVYDARKGAIQKWVDIPIADLEAVFPTTRGNVYHNFSDPVDRTRLVFDPFDRAKFRSASSDRTYPPETDPGIYAPDDPYHGTMLDGWECLFYLTAPAVAADLAVIGRIDSDPAFTRRAIELLLLLAKTIRGLPTDRADEGQFARILTYHREGDNKILYDSARAYELLRDEMTAEQREIVERDILERLLDDIMLEPFYPYDHNNVYQWYRTILQSALALEREDLIDWCFGYGAYDETHLPEHRSLSKIVATHFNDDGAFWELCSGYHLYPMYHFCELAVLTRNLSTMDPVRFPPDQYDYTQPASAGGRVIKNALEWFLSMAMPDRSMTIVGDSTVARAGMDSYYATAEIGYRYFGVYGVGDYVGLRESGRQWDGLFYGAPEIVQRYTDFTSSCLSSGWVSLRNDWRGNRVWAGLNALIPGGGHQHADRLTLTWFAQGQLLAIEKATPYNESVIRELGTFTQAHNTVVVDKTPQKQGEALEPVEVPVIAQFFDGPIVKYAEVHGDKLYPQTPVYRRAVAMIEDFMVDYFRVEGGETYDWIVNHAGPAPELSIELAAAPFDPIEWLANGTDNISAGDGNQTWSAQWNVADVTSRLTMMAAPQTTVYRVETYPIQNAVITSDHPPCQTLCVRRLTDEPFLAVWDAWRDTPNVIAVARGDNANALRVTSTSHDYHLLFGPGTARFNDGISIESDGAFCLIRDADAMTLIGGTHMAVESPAGSLELSVDKPATVAARYNDGVVTTEVSDAVQYWTRGGRDYYADPLERKLEWRGNRWKIDATALRYAGHTKGGDNESMTSTP